MSIPEFRTQRALPSDADQLALIRVMAMRPSLEAVGRFDPIRAKARFLTSFTPDDTQIIYIGEIIIGFYVLRRYADHLYLDHFYIAPDFQRKGVGRLVVEGVKREAKACHLPLRLMALNGSRANDFYRLCGFRFVSSDGVDTIYEWLPGRI